jgi:hypothetical protein
MIQAINVLKSYFRRGAKPTESQFSDLIDTVFANNGAQQAEQIRVLQQDLERLTLAFADLKVRKLGSDTIGYLITASIPSILNLPYSGQVDAIWKRIALRNGQIETSVRFLPERNGCIVIDSSSLSGFSEGEVLEVMYDFYII